jgi:molybdopterin converting factor subunit 1
MALTVLYFARLRDEIGASEETLSPPAEVRTVGDLMVWLRGRSDAHAHALGPGAMLKVAVNQSYAGPETPVAANDEVAIFPPVTGG